MEKKRFLDFLHRVGSEDLLSEFCDVNRFELLEMVNEGDLRFYMDEVYDRLSEEKLNYYKNKVGFDDKKEKGS